MYAILQRLMPQGAVIGEPRRIVLVRPCCIGDVVMATAALTALRETFPQAHISWAVGPWSARAIAHHPAVDGIVDTGHDLPTASLSSLWRFVKRLRAGKFDLAVSLVRSPLVSMALALTAIPVRAGLDSGGRGFGYNLRAPVTPDAREHESEIYLKVIGALARREVHAYANLPISEDARTSVEQRLAQAGISVPFIVAHPGGGSNPGAQLASKRYPPAQFAAVIEAVAAAKGAAAILIGGPDDAQLVAAVSDGLNVPVANWIGVLSFPEIGALSAAALCYIGNDSGLTHLAAASGGRTVMIMGPTDPQRYAPYTPNHLALWKPAALPVGGAARSRDEDWDWRRHGIAPDNAVTAILDFLDEKN